MSTTQRIFWAIHGGASGRHQDTGSAATGRAGRSPPWRRLLRRGWRGRRAGRHGNQKGARRVESPCALGGERVLWMPTRQLHPTGGNATRSRGADQPFWPCSGPLKHPRRTPKARRLAAPFPIHLGTGREVRRREAVVSQPSPTPAPRTLADSGGRNVGGNRGRDRPRRGGSPWRLSSLDSMAGFRSGEVRDAHGSAVWAHVAFFEDSRPSVSRGFPARPGGPRRPVGAAGTWRCDMVKSLRAKCPEIQPTG